VQIRDEYGIINYNQGDIMQDRVTVYDGDVGEIYSDSNHPEWGFTNCDENDRVLAADAYIIIAKNNWEILGEDDDGDIRVRTVSLQDQAKIEETRNRCLEFWGY
jgi:hypothetical protein